MEAKYIFKHTQPEIIYHQNICTATNVKSPSGKGIFIPNGSLDLHKRMRSFGGDDHEFSFVPVKV